MTKSKDSPEAKWATETEWPIKAPLSRESNYKAPLFFSNGHVQTMYPSLFRKVDSPEPIPVCIATPDQDELQADWYRNGARKVAVISHGLEGHNKRPYVLGMTNALLNAGWDVIAWNFRSCGGIMNKQVRFYHSGATEDLAQVVGYARLQGYEQVSLVGFSMGGNISLVYLGELGSKAVGVISGAAVFSVPCDLEACAYKLATPANVVYMRRFMKELKEKMKQKKQLFPDEIDLSGIDKMKTFKEFDDQFTGPLHGFADAREYWSACSSNGFIGDIKVPTLLVNARNDPFLAPSCFPYKRVKDNGMLTFEVPKSGGHVGFVSFNEKDYYWSEWRAAQFLNQH